MKWKINEILNDLMLEKQIDTKQLASELNIDSSTIHRWLRDEGNMYLSNAVAICDYFECSLEYLTNRTDTKLSFTIHKEYPDFYLQVRHIMKQLGITRYKMTTTSKFKDSYFTSWKKGTEPQIPTLIELADYFKTTLDYLVGRES